MSSETKQPVPKIEDTIHEIAQSVGAQGLAYWLTNYSEGQPSGDAELDQLARAARVALVAFESQLETLMEEHEAEFG